MNNQGRSVSRRIAACLLLVLAFVSPAASGQGVSPPFEAALVVADNQTRFEGVLDYDGDGKMDAISFWFPTSVAITVKGYRNDGTGKLVPDWSGTYPGIQNPPGAFVPVAVLAVGDFNADGLGDFVLTLNDYVGYWISNGAGVIPTVNWIFPEPAVVNELVAADFDGDGRTDTALREGATIRVFRTQSSGPPVLTSSTTVGVVAGSTTHIFATECDGDGLADVGAVNYGAGGGTAYVWLFALPGGVIQPPIQFQFTNVNGPMLVSGDIDGDADVDVVAFSMPVGNAFALYQVARRVGPTSFTIEPQQTGGPATNLVDLDFDGDLDGACCSSGGGGNAINNVVSKFELSLNDGTGSFWPAFEIAGMGATHLAGASDLDSDGDIDLIAGRCVYYGRGPSGLPPYPAAQGITVALEIADLDGDGDPDGRTGLPAFQRNSGDGLFSTQALTAPAPPPGHNWGTPGFPGDFDGDGDVDLLVESVPIGALFPDATHLLLNLGSGVYVDHGPATPPGTALTLAPVFGTFGFVPNHPANCVVADLDGDGDKDIVVHAAGSDAANGSGGSRVWLNQGGGSFVQGPDLAGLIVIAAADMNPDGIVDLIAHQVGGGGYSSLVILRGTPAGYLPPAVIDNDTHYLNRPAILDFDGDGDLDIISMGNLAVKRYTNLGSGTFSAAVPFPGAEPPSRTSTGGVIAHLAFVTDVDADGLPDVVTTPLYDAPNGMAILFNSLLNAATPTPGPIVRQIFAPLAFADLDGDGDEDAIGFVLASRNTRYGPAGAGRRVQYGVGIPGSGGITPVLGEVGPFRAGLPGEIRIRGGLGGASGLLAIGPSAASIPMFGGTLLVNATDFFPIQLGGQAGAAGTGGLTIPFVFPAALVGATIFHQAGFFDGGAVAGVAGTNGLLIEIGP